MTRDQQKRLNAMCGDLAAQLRLTSTGHYVHHSEKPCYEEMEARRQLDKDSWRWIFCGTYKGWKTVPAIEGSGFVMLGASSRDLTVEECGDVMTMIEAFGAERNVAWSDPSEAAAVAAYEAQP